MSSDRGRAGTDAWSPGHRARSIPTQEERDAIFGTWGTLFLLADMSTDQQNLAFNNFLITYEADVVFRAQLLGKQNEAAREGDAGQEVLWEAMRKMCEDFINRKDSRLGEWLVALTHRLTIAKQAHSDIIHAPGATLLSQNEIHDCFRARLATLSAETPGHDRVAAMTCFEASTAPPQDPDAAAGGAQGSTGGRGTGQRPGQAAARSESPRRGARGADPSSSGAAGPESPRRGASGASPSSPGGAGRGRSRHGSPSRSRGAPSGQGRGSSSPKGAPSGQGRGSSGRERR